MHIEYIQICMLHMHDHNMQAPHKPYASTMNIHTHTHVHTPKVCTLGCGHVVCVQCAKAMVVCPFCDQPIINRIRIYVT